MSALQSLNRSGPSVILNEVREMKMRIQEIQVSSNPTYDSSPARAGRALGGIINWTILTKMQQLQVELNFLV